MKKRMSIRSFLLVTVVLVISYFYQLPYYVSKPGMAKELEEVIQVENGYKESGSFMLTTVRMGRANIYSYFIGQFGKYNEIISVEKLQREDETEEEYMIRQLHYMEESKLAAIKVAYSKAGLPVDYKYKGVYVLQVFEHMPAEKKLKPGDRIFQVDNYKFDTQQQFLDYVGNKQEGEHITVTFERGKKTMSEQLSIARFKSDENKVGIGIALVEDLEVITNPNVTINTKDIGGPSAGLMFTLAIYNQLIEEDLTKGYQIAGTGTIDEDGIVGSIGGIDQKVVAAHKAGADIFFAPYENGKDGSNFDIAVQTAQDIKTKMEIVPVDTFEEAVQYLERLE